ncbi:putative ankyrin repeat protein RF_0381 [Cloeon dipterum]|uniref:putative ankyrin repeat protein RF_0381 n=1 Tax=Cloeon dipterum TaxID=197152 RepID=UPI00321FAA8F
MTFTKISPWTNSGLEANSESFPAFIKLQNLGLPLMCSAAKITDADVCRRLLDEGADLDATDSGITALHYAAMNKRHGEALVELFVSWGLRVNQKDDLDEEPIHFALRAKNFQVAKLLLELKYTANGEQKRNNLLHFCIKEHNLSAAKHVLEFDKTMLQERGEHGKTAFHLAAEFSDLQMCKWLVGQGASPKELDAKNKASAMHFAAFNMAHGADLTLYLISFRLNVNQRDRFDETPLHYALKTGNLAAAEQLLMFGASLDVLRSNENLLLYSVVANRLPSASFVYLKKPHLLHGTDDTARNALHFAAEFSDLETCRWLLDQGVDLHAVENNGLSVLHFTGYNFPFGSELVEFLVSRGLDVNGRKSEAHRTPLHCALEYGNTGVAAELVRLGARLDVRFSEMDLLHFCVDNGNMAGARFVHQHCPELVRAGKDALHCAARKANLDMCRWLIESGADPHILADNGASLLDYFDPGVLQNECKSYLSSLGVRRS